MKKSKKYSRRQLVDELISGLAQETIGLFKFGAKELTKVAGDMGSELSEFAIGKAKRVRRR